MLVESEAAIRPLGEAAWALAERLGCPTLELRGGRVEGGEWITDGETYLGFARGDRRR